MARGPGDIDTGAVSSIDTNDNQVAEADTVILEEEVVSDGVDANENIEQNSSDESTEDIAVVSVGSTEISDSNSDDSILEDDSKSVYKETNG